MDKQIAIVISLLCLVVYFSEKSRMPSLLTHNDSIDDSKSEIVATKELFTDVISGSSNIDGTHIADQSKLYM